MVEHSDMSTKDRYTLNVLMTKSGRRPKVSFFTFRSNAKNTNKATMLIPIVFHEVIINK